MTLISRTHRSSRPAARTLALALEPRLLFDGAGAVAAVDHADSGADHGNTAELHRTETQNSRAPGEDARETRPTEHLEKPATGNTLLLIDARLADLNELLAELPSDVHLRLVQPDESGLAAIDAALNQGGRIDAVHILSHGSAGSFTLGRDTLDQQTLLQNAGTLQTWAQHLAPGADLLLYGCDIAQGERGEAFIHTLAHLTGADIAASTNATGNAAKGGDWVLERATGNIEAGVLAARGYGEVLAAPTITEANPDEPVSALEDHASYIGKDIDVTGTGTDSLTATASVTKGTLSATAFTGNAAAVQTWLAGITYTYTGSSETGDTAALSLSIVNNTNGGTTNFTRNFAIAAENDAPTITPPASGSGRLSVAEGGSASFVAASGNGTPGSPVTQSNLGLNDKDNTQAQIIIKITSTPNQGVLKLGSNELTVGSTLAVSNINNLSYQHNGNQVLAATTDTFQITVDDGAGGLLTSQTITVDITPKNDAPTISGNITLIEGEENVPLTGGSLPAVLGGGGRGNLAISDPDDAAGTHTLEITALPGNGTLKYNGTAVTSNQIPNSAIQIRTGWRTRNFGAFEREPEQLDGSKRSRMS